MAPANETGVAILVGVTFRALMEPGLRDLSPTVTPDLRREDRDDKASVGESESFHVNGLLRMKS